jgi:CheY-like chemotaxis protein
MPETTNTHRPLVLVADPNAESAAMISRQLLWAGYDVVTASNGTDALELLDERRPDAAVLEVMMEGCTGYDVVRRLRSEQSTALLPVVLISARAGKLDRDFAFTVGADDYVKKPFRTSDLVSRLALLLPTPAAPVPEQPVGSFTRRRRRPARPLQPALAR